MEKSPSLITSSLYISILYPTLDQTFFDVFAQKREIN